LLLFTPTAIWLLLVIRQAIGRQYYSNHGKADAGVWAGPKRGEAQDINSRIGKSSGDHMLRPLERAFCAFLLIIHSCITIRLTRHFSFSFSFSFPHRYRWTSVPSYILLPIHSHRLMVVDRGRCCETDRQSRAACYSDPFDYLDLRHCRVSLQHLHFSKSFASPCRNSVLSLTDRPLLFSSCPFSLSPQIRQVRTRRKDNASSRSFLSNPSQELRMSNMRHSNKRSPGSISGSVKINRRTTDPPVFIIAHTTTHVVVDSHDGSVGGDLELGEDEDKKDVSSFSTLNYSSSSVAHLDDRDDGNKPAGQVHGKGQSR